ncbi:MAG: serine/threonine-protein kinase [Kofleriaceae bacterium]
MTTAAAELRDQVGPYTLVKAIGAGGSARVDLARIDRAYGFQRHVVLKRPLEHLRDDPKAASSLRREARIGGQLRHPNLVAVLDAGVHDTYDYLVLEYIHGASLRTLMQTDAGAVVRDLPLATALAIIVDAARGLHHAHELADDSGAPLGLVHRDVSPGNVLVGLDGTVKLADFGIAKETRVTTLSGSMHGTVTYMAPEQCRGHAFDRRADIWALGVILYELVTGSRLFWADNDVASLHRVLSGTIPRPRKLKAGLDATLEDIVMTALAVDPAKRFASASELADALERYAGSHRHLLTARAIAAWVEDVMGPREVPWLGSATIPDIPRGEGSLVELIAASADQGPLEETFGPSDPVAAPLARPPRRTRTSAGMVIGLALAASAVAMVFAPGNDDQDVVDEPPIEVPRAVVKPAPPPVPAAEPEPEITLEPAPSPLKPKPQPQRPRPRPVIVKPEPAAPVVETPGSAAPPAVKLPAKAKPVWGPGIVLPSDVVKPP